jgi:multiple sugar transport system permease protein
MSASRRAVTLYLPLSLATILLLFPFYWMLITSLKTNRELIDLSGLPFWVLQPTLEHYRFLFAETGFLRWALNTLTISIVATAISLVCSILAGGAGAIAGAIFVTYLVPQTLLFLPLLELVRQLGLGNSLWSMILTYPTILIPFGTWLLMGYFRRIPRELEESAYIDGASRLRAMTQIVLPLALPGILSAGIFAFTLSWNEFIYALVFTTSTDIKTIPVGVVTELVKGDVYFWGSLMAGALLGSVPVALIYSFFVENYVGGLTAGAVKG